MFCGIVLTAVSGCRSHADEAVVSPPAEAEQPEDAAGPADKGPEDNGESAGKDDGGKAEDTDGAAEKAAVDAEKNKEEAEKAAAEAKRYAEAFKCKAPPYQPGEEFIYTLKWSGIAAGKASIKVVAVEEPYEGHKVIKLDSLTESNAFVSAFYDVHDVSYSLVDLEGGFSRFYQIDKKEGRHVYVDSVAFDYEKGIAHFKRHENDTDNPTDIKALGYLTDPVSVVFYYRLLSPLKLDDEIDVPINTGRDNYILKMRVDRKDLIKVRRLGTVKALRIVPAEKIEDAPALGKGESHMWIEETTGIPLRVAVDLSFGSVTMFLVEAKNAGALKALTRSEIRAARKAGY